MGTAVLVYGTALTGDLLHIDEEIPAAGADPTGGYLSVGRWGLALVRRVLLPDPAIPFVTSALSLLLLAAAAVVTARMLDLPGAARRLLVVLYLAFPQFAYQLEFQNQSDAVALGILCATLATWPVIAMVGRPVYVSCAALTGGAVLLGLAIGCYQSILFVPPTLCALAWATAAGAPLDTRRLGGELLAAMVLVGVGYGLYRLVAAGALRASGIPESAYLSNMIGWIRLPWRQALHDCVRALAAELLGRGFYGERVFVTAWPALILAAVAAGRGGIGRGCRLGLFAAAALVLPFALIPLLGGVQPPRSFVAAPIGFAGILALAAARWPRLPWPALAAAAVLFGAVHVGRLFAADAAALAADRALGVGLLAAMYRADPGFDAGRTPVYLPGSYAPLRTAIPARADLFGQSFFTWDGGNPGRMAAFLKAAGIAELTLADGAQMARLRPHLAELPSWPNPNSARMIEGVMVVKLSSTLSPQD